MRGLGIAAGVGIGVMVTTTWARVARAPRHEGQAPRADAIVVFGAAAWPSGPSPELRARLDHAHDLYRAGGAGILLCSGGQTNGISEPRKMESDLIGRGVSAADIVVDESGSSTRRTVAAARRRGEGRWRSVTLVSSPYHMHRIMREARRQGLPAIPSPALRTPVMERRATRLLHELREVAAVWWYAVTSRLSA